MGEPPVPRIADIKAAVASRYRISRAELDGRSQLARIAQPRQMAMTLACELTRHSGANVGRLFGRDHTTVIHARRQVAQRVASDLEAKAAFSELRSKLAPEKEQADG
jgi:chromosomal replication initiator protein